MRKGFTDIGAGLFMLLVATAFLLQSGDLSGVSWLFPRALMTVMFLGGVYLIGLGAVRVRAGGHDEHEEPIASHRILIISISSIVYGLLIPWLGFYVSSALFLFGMAMTLGGKEGGKGKATLYSLVFAILLCVLVWGGFNVLLAVPTPKGQFF